MACEDNKKLINASTASGDEDYKLECLTAAKEHLPAARKETGLLPRISPTVKGIVPTGVARWEAK
ncbi:MAG: hypothetical protein GY795_07780 [Desulfobacterales bacterium]|nr:hypothetical protein [Desulfobacterales bacterium]